MLGLLVVYKKLWKNWLGLTLGNISEILLGKNAHLKVNCAAKIHHCNGLALSHSI